MERAATHPMANPGSQIECLATIPISMAAAALGAIRSELMLKHLLGAAVQPWRGRTDGAASGARGPKHLTPHVTLMYAHGGIETQPIEPIGWEVREFVLVHSLIGEGRHVHLGRWPLQG